MCCVVYVCIGSKVSALHLQVEIEMFCGGTGYKTGSSARKRLATGWQWQIDLLMREGRWVQKKYSWFFSYMFNSELRQRILCVESKVYTLLTRNSRFSILFLHIIFNVFSRFERSKLKISPLFTRLQLRGEGLVWDIWRRNRIGSWKAHKMQTMSN